MQNPAHCKDNKSGKWQEGIKANVGIQNWQIEDMTIISTTKNKCNLSEQQRLVQCCD